MTALAPRPVGLPVDGPLPAETADVLDAALRPLVGGLDRSRRRLVSASVPVGWAEPVAVLETALGAGVDASYWHQPGAGIAHVGVGVAHVIELEGPDRFDAAAARWAALLDGAAVGGPAAGRDGAGPHLLGGATFADRRSTDPVWAGFETGRLEVPTLLVSRMGERATLTATLVLEPEDDAAVARDDLRAAVQTLARPGRRPQPASAGTLSVIDRRPDLARWRSAVARAAGAVGRGRLDKVVLARRVDLEAVEPFDLPTVLRRLETGAPTSTVFAFVRGGRAFIGATPERLAEARGRAYRTIALAGTVGRGETEADDERLAASLLASEKDREEHAVVVAMLRDTLGPMSERLEIAPTPHVVRLRTVQHLASEVSGTLRAGESLLGLVGRLHPTPAVGGWPREDALELIDEQEGLDRGWYAGPVGWLDAAGDGEFVVALRSGVVAGAHATLFAGCGIVGDSEPDREWAEAGLKLRALASALGRIEGDEA